jgi:hypothetical protein
MFYFIALFPPKESMKEFVENRGRQDENGPKTIIAGISWPSGPSPSFNVEIVVAILPTLQTFCWEIFKAGQRL